MSLHQHSVVPLKEKSIYLGTFLARLCQIWICWQHFNTSMKSKGAVIFQNVNQTQRFLKCYQNILIGNKPNRYILISKFPEKISHCCLLIYKKFKFLLHFYFCAFIRYKTVVKQQEKLISAKLQQNWIHWSFPSFGELG